MSPKVQIRVLAVTLLCVLLVILGTKIEKGLFLNRHMDVCMDDTSPLFRHDLVDGPFCNEALDVFK